MAQVYDSSTGELVDQQEVALSISAFASFEQQFGNDAINMSQMMLARRTDLTPKQQQFMLSTYSGVVPDPIGKHINEVFAILGGMVQYHPPYKSKPGKNGASEDMPGYFKLLLKTNKIIKSKLPVGNRLVEIKRNMVIETSSTKIVEYFLTIMNTQGWFDLPEPIICFFSGTQSEGYIVSILSEDELETVQKILDEYEQEM